MPTTRQNRLSCLVGGFYALWFRISCKTYLGSLSSVIFQPVYVLLKGLAILFKILPANCAWQEQSLKRTSDSLQGGKKRMATPISKSSDNNFTLSGSILYNELFIMNLSLTQGTVCPCRSIRTEDTHENIFSVRS